MIISSTARKFFKPIPQLMTYNVWYCVQVSVYDVDWSCPTAIVVGNERRYACLSYPLFLGFFVLSYVRLFWSSCCKLICVLWIGLFLTW